ncbi:MAG TPA: sugar ABC transporter substrate-binding protein, partial [Lachnospiraceae bacterium]|nr:sugar ABC transporter substrate-binding protein [Lachnospiraceae bacterium]
SKVVPFEVLTDDWYYYCLENPPQFLDGYPNDGSVLVDPNTYQVSDYNTSETAKKYFRKLNEEYRKGILDPECFMMTRDQYLEKIASGRVLCMVDHYWNIISAVGAISAQGLDGCTYVPLGITIEPGMHEMYNTISTVNDNSNGIGISVDCKDVPGALQFLNDLLSEEVTILRNWGGFSRQ